MSTALKEGKIWITVEDNGPGVPPEIESRIFEPFFTTKEVGLAPALGLSIAHGIMSDHGGHLHYERAALGGAAFVLDLPVVSVEMPTVSSTQIMAAPGSPPSRLKPRPHSEKILVVDDEKAIVEMLGEMLALLGYSAALCHSVEARG